MSDVFLVQLSMKGIAGMDARFKTSKLKGQHRVENEFMRHQQAARLCERPNCLPCRREAQ